MSKLIKLLMLIVILLGVNCYLLHGEEVNDKLKEIILNIPDVIDDIDNHKIGRHAEFRIMAESIIDFDGNKIPDYVVLARYLDYGGTIVVVIEDIKTPVYWDLGQGIEDLEIIDNIIPNIKCLFFRNTYSHGYSSWRPILVGLWPKPEMLLNLEFGSTQEPGRDSDEDHYKFIDLDNDGLKEIVMEHIIYRIKENYYNYSENKVRVSAEYTVFKYDDKTRKVIEIKDKKMLKAANKLFDENAKKQ